MRKWIPFVIVGVAALASLAVFSRLPDTIPTHWGADGEINGTSPRLWGAFVIPVILLFIALLMRALPAIDPRRENYPHSQSNTTHRRGFGGRAGSAGHRPPGCRPG